MNILEEYLVSLGFKVDMMAFSQFQSTMNQADRAVQSASLNMSKAFTTAAGMIVSAIAGITVASASMLHELGKADLAYQKYGLRMYLTNQSAKELKTTLDALGESIEDAAFIPELRSQFEALYQQGRMMAPPGDYAEYMRKIQAISFEFKRMRLEVTYATQWIGYYLMKHLGGTINSIHEALKKFNDYITKNMPVWTEKVASALASVVNIGRSLVWLFTRELPGGLKVFQVALAALTLYLMASPIGMFITALGAALLLLEDFYGYTHGWESSKTLAPMWDWITSLKDTGPFKQFEAAVDSLKKSFESLAASVAKLWDIWKKMTGVDGNKIVEFIKNSLGQALDHHLWIMERIVSAWEFIAQLIDAIANDRLTEFLKSKLIDLQNFSNGKRPGDRGYIPGGYTGRGGIEKRDNGAATPGFRGASPTGRAPNQSDKWQVLAAKVSAKTGIPAELIYAQWVHESAMFSSKLYRETHNAGGLTQKTPNAYPQPDGAYYYRTFSSDEDFANAYAKYITHPDYLEAGITRARTPEEFARALKEGGPYYGDDEEKYANALRRHMGGYGRASQDAATAANIPTGGGQLAQAGPTVINTTNQIDITVPPGTDAEGYATAIAKALEPYQGRATQITIARHIRDVQGVGA